MEKLSRRDFVWAAIGSLPTVSLVDIVCSAQAVGGSIKPVAHKWLFEMNKLSKDVRAQAIKPTEWQDAIESLLRNVDLADLLKAIDFDRLAKSTTLYSNHETAEELSFARARVKGLPGKLSFAPFFYGMKKGVSVVPHGHRNMTTMHVMLKGEAHGWHYDRVADESKHLIIKPTKDKALTVGDVSTISSDRDNIHWFKATSEPVFMFNIGVYPLDPKAPTTGRDYVDPQNGQNLPNGTIRVPRLTARTAYKLYGKS
jgi:hypothetical protein